MYLFGYIAINFNEVILTACVYTEYGTEINIEKRELIVDLPLPDTPFTCSYVRCDLLSDAVNIWSMHRRW
jgi:hypothetical protein